MLEKELARHVIRATFRASNELQSLLALLEAHASEADYAELRDSIADAIAVIGLKVMQKVLNADPSLSVEIEATLAKYGCYL